MEHMQETFQKALTRFNEARNAEAQEQAIDQINQLRFDFGTMARLASIRHSIDTTDAFYDKEKDFFNQNGPMFSQLNNQYYKALIASPFKDALIKRKGRLLFDKAEQSIRTFSKEILSELQEENTLASEHQKLLASAQIDFKGKKRNLSQMAPFSQSSDRETRKAASKAVTGFYQEHEAKLDEIYDKLIKVRTKIAKKLGYPSFTELAYDRLGRTDYDANDVAQYRKQVIEQIVPLNTALFKRKQKRLNLDPIYHYDLSLDYLSGNPTPKGDKDWMVEQASHMYREMSDETDAFFTFMREKNLLDLEAKKGKAGGGYCTFISNYDSPFIFANFNGTKHDVDVLTHEAGHAFQMYMSRHHEVPEYHMATMEVSEIHSMSMEFFAWPWIDNFFKEDTEKYKFSHLSQALGLISYGNAIDEFQHEIYANPNLTKKARKALWKSIDKKYFPYKVYDDNAYLEAGNGWQGIMHIFAVPFYMIDYTIAQVCAFQFWVKSQTNKDAAWENYVKLCKAGGSRSFLDLLKLANLENPFTPGTLSTVIPEIENYLNAIDDSRF